jgi:soluble lytic murein transglycosylase-like protein
MKQLIFFTCFAATAAVIPSSAFAQRSDFNAMIASHAQANGVPEALVHRVIVRESRYRPEVIGRGGAIGLMQIKLATARGLGYSGTAEGLRDPNTNLTYAVKYLAGAYRAANGDHQRAVQYYASGYYYAAKQQRLQRVAVQQPVFAPVASAGFVFPAFAGPGWKHSARSPANAYARQFPAVEPVQRWHRAR